MEYPEEISNIFLESLEPRWFYGYKGFTETTVGGIPSAIANAIYNATGVRIKDHPITQEKIIMGLKALSGNKMLT
jgi:CO/xanthine dehydrogenase Mo-binding subunit